MNTKDFFLSCDWGTSSFRLRLIKVPSLQVIAATDDSRGIAAVYALWNNQGSDPVDRFIFYQDFIKENIDKLEQQVQFSLSGVSLIISGMASANIGMIDLPYKHLPFSLDGSDLIIHSLPASPIFLHDTIIVSGASSDNDVMRGEEVQLIGSVAEENKELVYIFPGTHSKHVYTKSDKATGIKTYMTGEIFHLLSTKSILASSVIESAALSDKGMQQAFAKGVNDSERNNPLHAFFLVRTNQLFNTMSKEENYYYLSGLLIGLELSALQEHTSIALVSDGKVKDLYHIAFQINGISIFKTVDINEALIKGHHKILQRYRSYQ